MTAMSVAGASIDPSSEAIPLGKRLDGIRPIIPVPEAAGKPDMTLRRRVPTHTWDVVDAAGRSLGFLCVYASNGTEEINIWIYGENQGRVRKWWFKRVPEFNSAIAEHNLRDRPTATIVASDTRPVSEGCLPGRNSGHERIWVLASFDCPDSKLIPASDKSSGARMPIAFGEPASSNHPAPQAAPITTERTSTSNHTGPMGEQARAPGPSAKSAQQDDMTAGTTRKVAGATFETDRSTAQAFSDGFQRPQAEQMMTVRAADVEPQAISWLWPGRIPGGKLTMIVGDPGVSKSLLATYLTATVSRGALWPLSADPAPRGSVLVVSTEDDASDTIAPRLQAAGADMTAVHLFREVTDHNGRRSLDLIRDMAILEQKAVQLGGLKLIIIDPITACLGRTNQNATGMVRAVLTCLADFAARTGIAVVVISHLNKSSARSAIMRITGSLAFVAVVRAAFLLIKDPTDARQRLLLPIKNNLGEDRYGLSFHVESVSIGTGMAPRVVFDSDTIVVDPDEALSDSRSDKNSRPALEEAKDFLLDYLTDGAMPALDVQAAAQAIGISPASLRRARKELGITPQKSGMAGEWRWKLPELPKVLKSAEDAHSNGMSTFVDDECLRSKPETRALQARADQHE